MGEAARVVVFGLGPIGRAIGAAVVGKTSLRLVGAVDVAPALRGRPLSEVVPGASSDARVAGSIDELMADARPDVVLHATGSYLDRVYPQFEELLSAGCNVITTCEEAGYATDMEKAEQLGKIDALCRCHGVRLLATGINPGFAMDVWPLVASAHLTRLDSIDVHRVVDAASRREPLQRKVGSGMTVEEFRREVHAGRLGHVGLEASARMLAKALGREVMELSGAIEPVTAEREVTSRYFRVPAGKVVGLRQDLTARLEGQVSLRLYLEMYLGAPNPRDELVLAGDHTTQVVVDGGFPGDSATAAILVNSVAPALSCSPGYLTMLDLPFFGCAP